MSPGGLVGWAICLKSRALNGVWLSAKTTDSLLLIHVRLEVCRESIAVRRFSSHRTPARLPAPSHCLAERRQLLLSSYIRQVRAFLACARGVALAQARGFAASGHARPSRQGRVVAAQLHRAAFAAASSALQRHHRLPSNGRPGAAQRSECGRSRARRRVGRERADVVSYRILRARACPAVRDQLVR